MLEIKLEARKPNGERPKGKFIFKGTEQEQLSDTYEITTSLLNNLFGRTAMDKKAKFEILDSFLDEVKKSCEQTICYGGAR